MDIFSRRSVLTGAGALMLAPNALHAAPVRQFRWDDLVARARRMSRLPFAETPPVPGAERIDYDAFHKARFRADRSLWLSDAGSVAVQFFPVSATAPQPVAINIVENGVVRPLSFDPAMFDMAADSPIAQLGPKAAFAGFRVMHAGLKGDWLSFIGASYFRAAGQQNQYGLSARAIAINTSSGGEEFPRFTEFWLERLSETELMVHALLDGASITGAFRFRNSLDAGGVHQLVDAALFPRRDIRELGMMPMTSMFWYDQASSARGADWRPEVHDSDLLLVQRPDGARDVSPLSNPSVPSHRDISAPANSMFALLQRDRDFAHYQDDGVFYDRRPSLIAQAGRGAPDARIRLYSFPATNEYVDNVAAYWAPQSPVRTGQALNYSYRLDWQSDEPALPRPLAVLETLWRGPADNGGKRILADFRSVPSGALPDLKCAVSQGRIVRSALYPLVGKSEITRAIVEIIGGESGNISMELQRDGQALSEIVTAAVAG